MKIALIGYGKMGKAIEAIAYQRNHTIEAFIHSSGSSREITAQSLGNAAVCIDFSHPHCAVAHAQSIASLGRQLVIGTTGWYDHLDIVKGIVEQAQIGCFYSPNFSIGVSLFLQIVALAAKMIHSFDQYDVALLEQHHNKKMDSPSGTAKAIAQALLKEMKHKTSIICDPLDRQIEPHELHLATLRCGSIPGTHSVLFDSIADTITLTHQARTREGFALGAVIAAEWIMEKKGLYTMDDLYADRLKEKTT